MARRRSVTSQLYRAARISNNVSSATHPKKAVRRGKNLALGRILGKLGFWRALWH